MKFQDKKGFTLIELLVVISIIGLLSSVVLASLNTARIKARDIARIQAIKQIQNALEIYRSVNNTYPVTTVAGNGPWRSNILCDEFISINPVDPNDVIPGISTYYKSMHKFGVASALIAVSDGGYGCLYYTSDGNDYKFTALQTLEGMCPLSVNSPFGDPINDAIIPAGRCAVSISTPNYKNLSIRVP